MQAEITIIGAMLENESARLEAIASLVASDFSLDACARTFKAISRMVERGDAVDLVTVGVALGPALDAVGGFGWLTDAMNGVPRNCAIGMHIKSVLNASVARRGYNLCHRAQQRLLDPSERADEVLDDLSQGLTLARPEDSYSAAQAMPGAMASLDREGGVVIPTGIPSLDAVLDGGIRTKQFTVIGAQPSAGKSALCRQIERSAIASEFGVHAHSIEVPKEQWMLQHAANIGGVHPWKLRDKSSITPTDWSYLNGASKLIAKWNYFIDDAGTTTLDTLIAKSRLSAMRYGVKLFTVDYLQLLSGDDRVPIHRQMSQAAVRLKNFAKDYDVAVVALSQLARKGDINKRPTVQDLKESGDIEAAANVVLLNYRPKDPNTDQYTGNDEIIVGKQRDGAVGSVPMFFDYKTLTFRGR